MTRYKHLVAAALTVSLMSCGSAESPDSPDGVGSSEEEDGTVLLLDFDQLSAGDSTRRIDAGVGWPKAELIESEPGAVDVIDGAEADSAALSFPDRCEAPEGCPHALVQLPDDDRLNPGRRDFAFGARVRLSPDQTDIGSNIVQKGRYNTPGGQWKLQVDGEEGRPSCVLQGEVDESRETAKLSAEESIADDQWHEVMCTRDDDRLTITVDGTVRMIHTEVESIDNDADVHIGASGPADTDDQFHGEIDEVRFCLETCP